MACGLCCLGCGSSLFKGVFICVCFLFGDGVWCVVCGPAAVAEGVYRTVGWVQESDGHNGHTSVCLSVPMRHDTRLMGSFMLKITNRAMSMCEC